MAKKKKPPRQYLTAQAPWRRDLIRTIRDHELAASEAGSDLGRQIELKQAEKAEERLLLREQYYRDAIKDLRHYSNAYTPAKGFDLNKLAYIPERKLKRVERDIVVLRQQLAVSRVNDAGERIPLYQVVRPRTRKSKEALTQFTGQDGDITGRTAWFVNKSDPRQRVSLERKTVTLKDKSGRKYKSTKTNVELTQVRGGMVIYERIFRFPEPPVTFDDVLAMTKKMLRFMPRGWYVIETSSHGAIYTMIRKEAILSELQNHFLVYDVVRPGGRDNRGLAETVIGYRLTGMHKEDADREYQERTNNRIRMQQFRAAQRAKRRRAVKQRLRRWGF